ncbi:unnamed protein product, partial [Staurois parvus]
MNVTFCHFQISRRSVPRTSRRHRGQNPEDITGGHYRGHCRRD